MLILCSSLLLDKLNYTVHAYTHLNPNNGGVKRNHQSSFSWYLLETLVPCLNSIRSKPTFARISSNLCLASSWEVTVRGDDALSRLSDVSSRLPSKLVPVDLFAASHPDVGEFWDLRGQTSPCPLQKGFDPGARRAHVETVMCQSITENCI